MKLALVKSAVLAFVVVFFAVLELTQAYIEDGSCPSNVAAMQNFDVSKITGFWHKVLRYPIYYEDNERCQYVRIDYDEDAELYMNNFWTALNGAYPEEIVGSITPDPKGEGKLYAKLGGLGDITYWVLGTDYTNYMVFYTCTELGGSTLQHDTGLWILIRSYQTDFIHISTAVKLIVRNGINTNQLKIIDQDCPASELNFK